ncbi:hypothetical protein J6TS7_39390 [Paenibacillus dendritiformis]|uniref:hypothetical protein n=2 Tax=Paenibacillus TaxID=44249 RepID=UPI001B1D9EDC|nr:hypothetical protein [Paenibacillus dendritiformis]GIO80329.1 hypothetical protein J6TS7_39390 [Paenibacillus dendritiformis]
MSGSAIRLTVCLLIANALQGCHPSGPQEADLSARPALQGVQMEEMQSKNADDWKLGVEAFWDGTEWFYDLSVDYTGEKPVSRLRVQVPGHESEREADLNGGITIRGIKLDPSSAELKTDLTWWIDGEAHHGYRMYRVTWKR